MADLAWVSPLPPIPSGIADYSAELLAVLAGQANLSLFAPVPWDEARLPALPIDSLEALPARAEDFDLLVYHIGNNPYHVGIYDLALRLPGVVVLHDYVLHHLVARCTLQAGNLAAYLWHLAYERGEAGVNTAIRRRHGVFSEREQFLFPLNRVLLDRCRGVIVHSRWVAEQICPAHPLLPIQYVPHHLAPAPPCDRAAFRQKLGLGLDEVMLASFGFISPNKRVGRLLRAYRRLHRDYPQVRCFLVGRPDPDVDLAGLLADLGLTGRVEVTGYVDLETFHAYMAACDIAVNLRYPTAGETSGALIRLLGSGKAVIVSNLNQFADWPDEVCLKVDLGPAEGAMLHYYLRRLVEDAGLRRQLGENARRYVQAHHAIEGSARGYLSFFEQCLTG